jgi:excinuclease UvrABC nuclease subunit
MSISSGLEDEGSKGAANTSYIRHSTFDYIPGSKASAATAEVGFCQSNKNKSRYYKRKPQKPISNHGYEGLLSLMQCMLRRMDNMNKTCKPLPRVK